MIRNTPIDQPGTGIGISSIVDLGLVIFELIHFWHVQHTHCSTVKNSHAHTCSQMLTCCQRKAHYCEGRHKIHQTKL